MKEYIEQTSKKEKKTPRVNGGPGIPLRIRAEAEKKTGLSFENVNIFYNSPKPAELHAYAYTHGENVYLGPKQEKHLWHELGHVAQQKEGIVKPTGKIGAHMMNSDPALEQKADFPMKSENREKEGKPVVQQAVIQRKQTTPLRERIGEQGIAISVLGPNIGTLIEAYDKLENVGETKEKQISYLSLIMSMLSEGKKTEFNYALRIVQDELNFVKVQRFDAGFLPVNDPWEHMNDSPFLHIVAELAHDNDIPLPEPFSAKNLISALSTHHMNQIRPNPEQKDSTTFENNFKFVKDTIIKNGMLSHYSHNPALQVLHSTNYLKGNQILKRERLAKGEAVSESENVSKSQDVDAYIFRNTGFIFFFLERNGSAHRNTGFGKFRYTVNLASNTNILHGAWAILHDMAGQSSAKRSIRKGSKTMRVIESDYCDGKLIETASAISARQQKPNPNLFSILSLFLPTADLKFYLQNQGKEAHATIEDHISGNFLYDEHIINGIAMRITRELMTLKEISSKEFDTIIKNADALWEYILGLVHDVQIMIPNDVLPEQYDYKGIFFMNQKSVMAEKKQLKHVSVKSLKSGKFLFRSANNCFFDTMFPHMNHLGYADAGALREQFVAYQSQNLLPLLQLNDPIEYQHVQQFANFFNIAITVAIVMPSEDPFFIDFNPEAAPATAQYIIKYLPAAGKEEGGIGHYINF